MIASVTEYPYPDYPGYGGYPTPTYPTYPGGGYGSYPPGGYPTNPGYPPYTGSPSYPPYPGSPSYPPYPGAPSYPGYPGGPGGTPPSVPPTNPVPPSQPVPPPGLPVRGPREDAASAITLIQQSIEKIRTVPETDRGDESTKQARIAAYQLNLEAQKLLEQHFTITDQSMLSTLRRADASLEDANWQLAKKPSPDGRFNGVDIPGALRDSQTAIDLLNTIVAGSVTPPVAA